MIKEHTFTFEKYDGEITVEVGDDGIWVTGPDGMEIFVDLFYTETVVDEKYPHPCVHLFHKEHTEDALAFVRWKPGQLTFETESYQKYNVTRRSRPFYDLVVDLPLEGQDE